MLAGLELNLPTWVRHERGRASRATSGLDTCHSMRDQILDKHNQDVSRRRNQEDECGSVEYSGVWAVMSVEVV